MPLTGPIVMPTADGTNVLGSAASPIYLATTIARQQIGPWIQTNVAANQSAVQIGIGATGVVHLDWPMGRAGYLVGIFASFTVAPAGTDLTVSVFKNGTLLHATAILTVAAGATLVRVATFTTGNSSLAFASVDKLGVAITTGAGWTATTSDVTLALEIDAAL